MTLHAEVTVSQLCKNGEELCGDNVQITRTGDSLIVVVSDGLGSGVKANILATLTTKIASSMLARGASLDDVVETIAQTLPVCRERKIAYSTLQILRIDQTGNATLVEFDSPRTLLSRAGHVMPFPAQTKMVGGKSVLAGQFELKEDDWVIMVSDGVIHAGIGGLLPLGLGWEGLSARLAEDVVKATDTTDICASLLNCCEGYYLGKPGDDTTIVAVKIRRPRWLNLMMGPPASPEQDEEVVRRFLAAPGQKVVSGGTTATLVSRVMGKPLKVSLEYHDPSIPPIAFLDGIDLVTEGVLTLNAAADKLRALPDLKRSNRKDGATLIARLLMDVDHVHIWAGGAVNPAHQNPLLPSAMNIKVQVLGRLRTQLEALGKVVQIDWV
ncbi:MAG: stage sporulation protein [Firmicutes bacterium]|nr:stage sporulation protein [Bacillota bacterium]